MSANHEKVEAIFSEALRVKPADRPAYLDSACGEDAELRGQVEVLLQADAQAGAFLPEAPLAAATIVLPVTEQPGDRIGRYKLLQRIGEGGMGVVYMAEQEEPVRRQVALKIIKLGMDTRSVVARFEAERQALALMDHPNIARVLDAGATETGRPFFVMELVRGAPITTYCDKNHLNTAARLSLFIQVCHAIQHAHQKGIIHRDIKPSNVMVTLHDGVPVPKVIDFGVAKATGQRLTEKTLFTHYATMIGTPAYMSPEQAEMSGLDIDTRADVYALGVLLYELLTGTTPFPVEELLSKGYGEMQRIIAEVEPMRPSTRLSTMGMEEATTLSKNRQEKLPALAALVRGDLDWIVMKCLEKDRTRRYETANGLAADLKRHLSNEPVVARPPSTAYRMQRFVRRHRTPVVAAALVLVLLVAGVIGTSLGLFRAERERRNAVTAAHEAQAAQREAQAARARADDNAQKLEENLYFNRVALAQRELASELPNLRAAEELLDECPPPMRAWEWRYLKRLRLVEPMTLSVGQAHDIFGIAFSADNRHLAAACGDGQVRIWNLTTRQIERTLRAHTNFAFCVAFHPKDATRLASVGADGRIKLWNWPTGAELHSWPGPPAYEYGGAYLLAFSPDGTRLVTPGDAGVADVWDTRTFAKIQTLPGHELSVNSVAFSADGTRLATGTLRGIVRIWDARTGGLLREFGDLGAPASCVAFRPDGREIAAANFDRFVRLWNLDSPGRQPRLEFRAHTTTVLGVAYSADGQRLATTSGDGLLGLWDSASGRQVLVFRDGLTAAYCVRFSPDGNLLAGGYSDGAVRVRDATPLTGNEDESLLTLRYPGEIAALAVHPATKSLACAGDNFGSASKTNGTPVQIWEAGRDRLRLTLRGPKTIVFSLAFDPTGRLLAASGDDPAPSGSDLLKIWDLHSGREALTIDDSGALFAVAFSPDGQRLVGGGGDRRLKVWDANTGRKIGILGNHEREISAVVFSPDGNLLATASSDRMVKLWDATRLDEPQERPRLFEGAQPDAGVTMAFSPDSARLVIPRDAATARIWNIAAGNVTGVLESRGHGFLALAWSPDGRWIASSGIDCTVRLWETQTGRVRHTFRGHLGLIPRVAFVPLSEGLRVVSASLDQTVKYWDVTALEK